MSRMFSLLAAPPAAAIAATLMTVGCFIEACPKDPAWWWLNNDTTYIRSFVLRFGLFALLFVVPAALVARRKARPVVASIAAGFSCAVLATWYSWYSTMLPGDGLSVLPHYMLPYFVASTAYAALVVVTWPTTRVALGQPLARAGWLLCTLLFAIFVAFQSMP